MAQVDALLSQLPQCIQDVALRGIALSHCDLDIACLCGDRTFIALIEGAIEQGCNGMDGQKTLDFAREICTSAVPALNDSRGPQVIATFATISILSTVSVILRLISRKVSNTKYGWDDYLIIIALIFTMAENVNVLICLHFGFGKHIITLSLSQISSSLGSYFATLLLFAYSITLTKLSILFFYHRIFPSRRFTMYLILIGFTVIALCFSITFSRFFSCTPIQYFWDKSIPHGHCLNENAISYGMTGANIVSDFVVLCLPIPPLWGLKLPVARRLSLIGMFVLGGFVCISGIIRIPMIMHIDPSDLTWSIVGAGIWFNIETNLGIVCACLPTLGPLCRRYRFSTSSSGSKPSRPPFIEKGESELSTCLRVKSTGDGEEKILRPMNKGNVTWYSAALTSVTSEDQEETFIPAREVVLHK